ncbi:hypothetical protein ACLKA6_003193 [Drosophila palustris]
MEPSGRSGVAVLPNSPRGSEDSRSTEPNTLDMGPVLTLSPVRVADDRDRQDAARAAVGWGQTNWSWSRSRSRSRSWIASTGRKVTLAAGTSWSACGPTAGRSSYLPSPT